MAVDLSSYRPKGDKRNSAFFEEFLPRIYERRVRSGLEQVVGPMAAIVIQVDHGNALPYLAELCLTTPYRYQECWLNATHRIYLLKGAEAFPRLIVLEPLSLDFEDEITRWNAMYPLSIDKPNARYIGEVYQVSSCADLRAILEPQNIRFAYPGETVNPFYASEHLCFTFLSDYTYNRVGYVERPLDGLATLDLGDRILLDEEALQPLHDAAQRYRDHGLEGRILGIDHLATRVLAGEREDAILEYLTMVPYYYWGSYDIVEMNSSTNVTRHPTVSDDKLSPARVFTANNTPSYLNSLFNLPMPTEDFVRNFGRRMHHIAYEVADGDVNGEKNVDVVVKTLRQLGVSFLADIVGECGDQPNLRQIFSKSSPYSLLITEYVERCMGYDGFFTRQNVAALTEAAGLEERYEHGHVFD
ncbi:hypothetical protein [Synechococcus sp. CCY 9618]|uniref:hypothetical protein n=1 Tax=Synechococcus sp. CCY 9618 TaxID=2815602 RepID=UPI001C23CFDB|nr:hypothetical protein [Synechococcus sp. CCY 9618]